MRPILLLVLSFVLTAACTTNTTKYLVGSTGVPQTREQAQQTHVESASISGQLDKPLKLLSAPLPEYPRSLRKDGIVGKVRVQFTVESNGTVSNPVVLGSPPQELVAITLHAIMRWRFELPLRGGKPGQASVEQAFSFVLD